MILLSTEWIFKTVDPLFLIMLVVLVFLIFTMFRRNKKAQAEAQQRKSAMGPGQEVMTSYGLFGTVLSVDTAENKVVLELSPGNTATVHLQSVTKIIEPTAPADAEPVETEPADGVLPADPAPTTGVNTDRSSFGASPAGAGSSGRPETPEETLRRLEQQNDNPNR